MTNEELRRIMKQEGNFHEFQYKGYEGFALRTDMGHWCGYINLPRSHPWYGKDYDSINAIVHGGLTYGRDSLPRHDEIETDWVIGFDCAHWDDLIPMLAFRGIRHGVYRTIKYVTNEIKGLIEQAVVAERKIVCEV